MTQFKEGDLVVVVTEESEIIHAGDIGIVKEVDSDNMPVFVDFNGYDDGCWWCKEEELKPYTPIESFQVWQHNHQYMDSEQQEALRALLHRVQWDDEYQNTIDFDDSPFISASFAWDCTSEGGDYWNEIGNKIEDILQEQVMPEEKQGVCNKTTSCVQKTKPDGGSSGYYKLSITRASDGEVFDCEMGDIIYSVFGGDFDLGNIVKACRRAYLDTIGQGKDGAPVQYDMNKIKWFSDDFSNRVNGI